MNNNKPCSVLSTVWNREATLFNEVLKNHWKSYYDNENNKSNDKINVYETKASSDTPTSKILRSRHGKINCDTGDIVQVNCKVSQDGPLCLRLVYILGFLDTLNAGFIDSIETYMVCKVPQTDNCYRINCENLEFFGISEIHSLYAKSQFVYFHKRMPTIIFISPDRFKLPYVDATNKTEEQKQVQVKKEST